MPRILAVVGSLAAQGRARNCTRSCHSHLCVPARFVYVSSFWVSVNFREAHIPSSPSILYNLLLSEPTVDFSYIHKNHKESDGIQIKRKVYPRLCGKNI